VKEGVRFGEHGDSSLYETRASTRRPEKGDHIGWWELAGSGLIKAKNILRDAYEM